MVRAAGALVFTFFVSFSNAFGAESIVARLNQTHWARDLQDCNKPVSSSFSITISDDDIQLYFPSTGMVERGKVTGKTTSELAWALTHKNGDDEHLILSSNGRILKWTIGTTLTMLSRCR